MTWPGRLGAIAAVVGALLLLFIAYQLWGSALYTWHAQDRLKAELVRSGHCIARSRPLPRSRRRRSVAAAPRRHPGVGHHAGSRWLLSGAGTLGLLVALFVCYWLVSKSGAVSAYGDAKYYGGANNLTLSAPIVGIAGTADMGGYWLVGADGAVYCYGDARLWGTANTLTLNAPIVGIVGTLNGGGYWLVGADGGVYAFGNAPYYGSEGGQSINAKVTSIEPTANDGGYWLVGADGGVYAFGNAPFEGSEGGQSINAPVVGIVGDPSSQGYWLVGADGGAYAFGNAPFLGSAASSAYVPQPLDAPVIAAST